MSPRPAPRWFTSSHSNNGGNCVEVAVNVPDTVPVRDSKDRSGPAFAFTPTEWGSFVAAVRDGELGGA
ncbi:DUF397 domain-containing protein [Streptomyces sp. NPDC021020]|uniref:DUF397 domain-containing protein n=1 Tax=Streptomyces sp. NPDC021020 TaxID=3365109 RepID=UPI00379D6BDF